MQQDSASPVSPDLQSTERMPHFPTKPLLPSVTLLAASLLGLLCEAAISPRVGGLLGSTMVLFLASCCLSLPVATLLALLIGRTDVWGASRAQHLILSGILLPLPVLTASAIAAFDSQGWARSEEGIAPYLSQGLLPAILIHAIAAVPWSTAILLGALSTSPSELEEEGLLLLSPLRVLRYVTLPQLALPLIACVTWTAFICFTDMTVTDFFQVRSLAEEIYTQAALGDLSVISWFGASSPVPSQGQLGAAAQTILSPPVVSTETIPANQTNVAPLIRMALWVTALIWSCWRIVALRFRAIRDSASVRPRRPLELRDSRGKLTLLVWGFVGLVILLPAVSLCITVGRQITWQEAERVSSWSLSKACALACSAPWDHRRELIHSFKLASLASLGSVSWATIGLWASQRYRIVSMLVYAPLLVALLPAPLIGILTIRILNQPLDSSWSWLTWLYDRTNFAPVLVQGVRAYPIVLLLVYHALSSVPRDLFQAATVEGMGHWRQLVSVALPQRRLALGGVTLLGFGIALAELPATLLVLPPGPTTLTVRLFQLTHYGADDRVAALCLFVLLLSLTLAYLLSLAWKRASFWRQTPSK